MEDLCQHLYWQCSIAGGLDKVEAHLKRHIYYHNTASVTKRRWEKGSTLRLEKSRQYCTIANLNKLSRDT